VESKAVSTVTDLLSIGIELKGGGAPHGYPGKKGAKPDRQARRKPGSYAPDDAGDEPREARRLARADVPADSEIREGHQSDRCQSSSADFSHSPSPGRFFLRGRAQCSANGSP